MTITVDTCVWIALESERERQLICDLLNLCDRKCVQIYVSSRIMNFDSVKMDGPSRERLMIALKLHNVKIESAPFRFGGINENFGSRFGDGDFLSSATADKDELAFEDIFGKEPMQLPREELGAKVSNWIGDYDVLKQHYLNKRDIFVTLDTKVYFSEDKRRRAKEKLNLEIADPASAVAIIENMLNSHQG